MTTDPASITDITLREMGDYLLTGIDDALHARAIARTRAEGVSLKYVLLRLLEHYVVHGLSVAPGPEPTDPPEHDRGHPLPRFVQSQDKYIVVRRAQDVGIDRGDGQWSIALGVGSHMLPVVTMTGTKQQARRVGLMASYIQHCVDGHDPDDWQPRTIEPDRGQTADASISRAVPSAWIDETAHRYEQIDNPTLSAHMERIARAHDQILDLFRSTRGGTRRRRLGELQAALPGELVAAVVGVLDMLGLYRSDSLEPDAAIPGTPVRLVVQWARALYAPGR